MPYDNMPFKNKQAAKSDRTGMSAGPGNPPKKGTASTETKLDRLAAAYEAGDVETKLNQQKCRVLLKQKRRRKLRFKHLK